ncbi:hypothetical protein EDEG_02260 [Edhazardia aedis USNM 41457]|uniref:RRM domain-containing protein n=1 Tax=Edhazardia aedis (strain USNM 41457) TaxID=1003232 RepID=J8ZUP2_EDHAE|nr:hypothetical protein EDEG_02260 [Edhazardia aedis USNM 41457]|eukprot:EJW03403.1 hypothetical protein EDEG_02260 [Edhazardia aedis USNM 41457]
MRIFIKNLPKYCTETDIKKHFSKVKDKKNLENTLSITEVSFPNDKTRKFCFIGYKTKDEAHIAWKYFNNTYYRNSKIVVDMFKRDDYKEKRFKLDKLLKKTTDDYVVEGVVNSAIVEIENAPEVITKKDVKECFKNLKHIELENNKCVLTFTDLESSIEQQKNNMIFMGKNIKFKPISIENDDITFFKSLFFDFTTVIERVCSENKIRKEDLVNLKDKELGTRISILEAHLVEQTSRWLKENGICIMSKNTGKLNKCILVIRNFDLINNLEGLEMAKVKVSPSKCVAIAFFNNENDAENAYKHFALRRVQNKAIYCDFLPDSMVKKTETENKKTRDQANSIKKLQENKEHNQKNLPLSDNKNQKDSSENKILDDIFLKNSSAKEKTDNTSKKDTKHITSKIIIKNVPFQANKEEIKKIIESQVKIVDIRMPVKINKQHRGFCFVTLEDSKTAEFVCDYFGKSTHLYGRRLIFLPANE